MLKKKDNFISPKQIPFKILKAILINDKLLYYTKSRIKQKAPTRCAELFIDLHIATGPRVRSTYLLLAGQPGLQV